MIQREKLYTVSAPPHWHSGRTSEQIVYNHLLALSLAAVFGIIAFGIPALRVIALSCGTAVIAEAITRKLVGKKVTVGDGTALLEGLLFAFLLPASAPWWLVVLGAIITIYLGKQVFGGVGSNPLPAPLVGWAVLKVSWPGLMSFDQTMLGTTLQYPLAAVRTLSFGEPVTNAVGSYNYLDLFLGSTLGSHLGPLGGVQVVFILAGGIYLVARGYIKPHIPIAFLVSFILAAAIIQGIDPSRYADPVFHLLTGTAILGAFFLATDCGTSPVNHTAMILYGVTAGVLTVIIRTWGIYLDAVPFGILLAGLIAPLLDRIRPRAFGKA